jgi:hypothetical protein
MADPNDYPDLGEETSGGWGQVVEGGGDNDHITITNEASEEGPGFHITTDDDAGGTRDYFDNDGNYKRTE